MTEEFRLHQLLRDGGHIECNERVAGAGAMAVQCARHQLFAGAGLAVNQHCDVALGESANRAEHFLHGRRVANNFCGGVTALALIDLIVLSPLGLGAGHGGHHLFDIKGLWQVFECPFFV